MQTRDERIFRTWRAIRKRYDYRRGEGVSPLMRTAQRWQIPIWQVRRAIERYRGYPPTWRERGDNHEDRA